MRGPHRLAARRGAAVWAAAKGRLMNQSTAHSITLWCAIFAKLEKGIERQLSNQDLTMMQYRVLLQLALPETARVRQTRLARVLMARPSAVSMSVDALRQRGLVSTGDDADDARVLVVSLTEEGKARLDAVDPLIGGFLEASLARLDADELSMLMEMLYDSLARPGGFFAYLDPSATRGQRLPLAYLLTSMDLFSQVVTTTAKKGAGLSLTEYRFLLELLPKRRGIVKRLRAKEMVSFLRVKRSYVTTTSYKLEDAGLIVREPDSGDARGILFGLTAEGERTVSLIGDDIAAVFESLLASGSISRMRTMILAKKLLAGVDGVLEEGMS